VNETPSMSVTPPTSTRRFVTCNTAIQGARPGREPHHPKALLEPRVGGGDEGAPMGWFRRDRAAQATDDEHVRPVEIDLGLQKEFEVQMQVERLKSVGVAAYLVAQSEHARTGSLGPKHCHVYVRPDDELRVRAELASAGLL
jgi:hypothetical protein